MSELKFIITGSPGVGKTTAITSLCDVPPIFTDAKTTDSLSEIKATTTTAFDFGEIILDGDTCVRLYGTPGQERFKHMWEILAQGALGLIILVDHSRPNPIEDLQLYLDSFASLVTETGVAIGINRMSSEQESELEKYYEALEKNNLCCPILNVDPREREDMTELMDALMSCIEYSAA